MVKVVLRASQDSNRFEGKVTTMNVYEYIRNFAKSAEVEVSEGDVARIASTLRTANFRGELDERERELARPIVAVRIGRIAGAKSAVQPVEATKKKKSPKEDKVVDVYKDSKSFEKIDAMVKQGKCARCGQPTEKVALANYEDVHFCPQCRTTLW